MTFDGTLLLACLDARRAHERRGSSSLLVVLVRLSSGMDLLGLYFPHPAALAMAAHCVRGAHPEHGQRHWIHAVRQGCQEKGGQWAGRVGRWVLVQESIQSFLVFFYCLFEQCFLVCWHGHGPWHWLVRPCDASRR